MKFTFEIIFASFRKNQKLIFRKATFKLCPEQIRHFPRFSIGESAGRDARMSYSRVQIYTRRLTLARVQISTLRNSPGASVRSLERIFAEALVSPSSRECRGNARDVTGRTLRSVAKRMRGEGEGGGSLYLRRYNAPGANPRPEHCREISLRSHGCNPVLGCAGPRIEARPKTSSCTRHFDLGQI